MISLILIFGFLCRSQRNIVQQCANGTCKHLYDDFTNTLKYNVMTFLLYFHHFRLVFLAMSCTFVARLCISHPTLVDRWHRCVDAAKKIIRQHKIIIMIIMIQLKKKQCFSCENSQIRHFVAKIYKCGVFCHENLKHVYSEI